MRGVLRDNVRHEGVPFVLPLRRRRRRPPRVVLLVDVSYSVARCAGFFLSIANPRAERPNRLIALVYLGGAALAVGVVTLGIGLLT